MLLFGRWWKLYRTRSLLLNKQSINYWTIIGCCGYDPISFVWLEFNRCKFIYSSKITFKSTKLRRCIVLQILIKIIKHIA